MNYISADYVVLNDYRSISVKEDYLQITDDNVNSIVSMELSADEVYIPVTENNAPQDEHILLVSINGNQQYYLWDNNQYPEKMDVQLKSMQVGETKTISGENGISYVVELLEIYRYATIEDTAFVLSYYDCSSMEELSDFIRKRASQEILFNYALDIIFENTSIISLPAELENQLTLDIQTSKDYILEEYATFEEYLEENAITEEEFEEQIASWYYEPMIYKAILDAEGVAITDADLNLYQDENQLVECDQYEIYSQLAQQKVREILLSTVQITE